MHCPDFQGKLWVNWVKFHFTRVIANLGWNQEAKEMTKRTMGNGNIWYNGTKDDSLYDVDKGVGNFRPSCP